MADKVKQIRFHAIDKGCVSHLCPGQWRHPRSDALHYKDMAHWQNFAKIAEEGLFETVFIADGLHVPDVYRGNDLEALRSAIEVPVIDPLTIAAVSAAATKHIGFGITAGVFFEHPFPFARRLSSMDHLTKGRISWNIVTGYLPSVYHNMGIEILPHDQRYDYADEYMEVIYKLLEGSWEDDSVVLNYETGAYADPYKIHHIGHHGKYFDVPGVHICEPSIQRTPVLFQAGSSARGIEFATTHAEAIFIGGMSKEHVRDKVKKIRASLAQKGRDPHSAKIFSGSLIVVDETQALAEAKYNDFIKYINTDGTLANCSGWLGVDLSKFGLDDPLVKITPPDMHISWMDAVFEGSKDDGKPWTVRDLVLRNGLGGGGSKFVGDAKHVADVILDYVEELDLDGLILSYVINPGTIEDVVHYLVPELQRRGAYKHEYAEGSLRNKLFGRGDRLPDEHIGAQYRVGGSRSTVDDYTAATGRVRAAQGAHP